MIAIMLICGGALFLAIGIGALLTPSSQSSTACPHDWPWRSPLTDLEGQDFAWRSAERSRYRAEQNHVAPLRVPLPVTPARSFRRDIIPPRPGGFGGFCQIRAHARRGLEGAPGCRSKERTCLSFMRRGSESVTPPKRWRQWVSSRGGAPTASSAWLGRPGRADFVS
jgi:hypothetical protein